MWHVTEGVIVSFIVLEAMYGKTFTRNILVCTRYNTKFRSLRLLQKDRVGHERMGG